MSKPAQGGRLWRLCQKELKETIRDRRTIVTLLLMPLLVYPLLSMALNRFLLSSGGDAGVVYRIGVADDDQGVLVRAWLEDEASDPPQPIRDASGGQLADFELLNTVDADNGQSLPPRAALEAGVIDVAVEITNGENGPRQVTLLAYRGDARSQNARRILVERLQWLRLAYAELVAETHVPQYTRPTDVQVQDIGEPKDPPILATVIPLVLVLMTITGAVYPAIDLTAGERERGTMESLMASPVSRFAVLFAKYVAVVTVALLTALANLLAMFTTLYLGGLMRLLTGGDAGFPWLAVLQILGLLILFSGFFSAVLLSLTSFARSFKEAQAYLIPVMLLSLTPGMLSLMPGVELTGALAIAPLVNIVLLAREILAGSAPPAAALAAVLSTIAYAAAALGVAAKLFGSDAVTRTSDQSFGSLFHRPAKFTAVPSVQAAALMLALLVPIYFVLSNLLMQYLGAFKSALLGDQEQFTDAQSLQLQILSMTLSAVALIVVFGLIPWVSAWLGKNRYRTTFRLVAAPLGSFVGAIVIGLGAWALAHEAFVIADALGIGGLSEERIAQVREVLSVWKLVPPWVLLATLALTPAVIEELCFRGYLFSAFSKTLSPTGTIVVTALLFGMFHVLTGSALLVERFVPSTLLGLLLGWVAVRTGSVYPGMVLHLVHNGLLELVGHYHEQLEFLGTNIDNQAHLPWTWIVIATTIAAVGVVILWASTRRRVDDAAVASAWRGT